MKSIRIATVLGTRPEVVKMVPLIKELEQDPYFEPFTISTGQQKDLLQQALRENNITPDFDLNVMEPNQSLGLLTANIVKSMESTLKMLLPDIVLVHGDTTTALASALAAFYTGCKIGHVEAGLRSYDKSQPFPEEANRQLIAGLANWHFAPTQTAQHNLLRENVPAGNIFVTGNTVIDQVKLSYDEDYYFEDNTIRRLINSPNRLVLVTMHRRENHEFGVDNICAALKQLANMHSDIDIMVITHPNPAVKEKVHNALGNAENIYLVPPQTPTCMHNLLARTYLVITDSGGIQEEAPFFGKPVLVLRNVTERMESIECGVAKLVGNSTTRIVQVASKLLSDERAYNKMSFSVSPYGDGCASERIVQAILHNYQLAPRPTDFQIFRFANPGYAYKQMPSYSHRHMEY